MGAFVDLTGKRFGKLVVVGRADDYISPKGYRSLNWSCVCDCGNETVVRGCNLRSGASLSCGCNRICNPNRRTHGMKNSRIYSIWRSMKDRCFNENCVSYKNYGARGITVCDEWANNFSAFYDWAIKAGYSECLSIDRIDNDGNYTPSNCRWATPEVQANNTRHNHMIEYNGKTLTLSQWSKLTGIKYSKIKERINKCGWSVEKTLTTP